MALYKVQGSITRKRPVFSKIWDLQEVSTVYLCLFYRETEKGKVYFGLCVDGNLLIRDPSAVQEAIQELKEKGLVLRIDDKRLFIM